MKRNNQINIPEATQAMEDFKMQAANDKGVPFTFKYSRIMYEQILITPAPLPGFFT